MKQVFSRHIPLSQAQIERLSRASVGVLLAGSAQLPKIARWMKKSGTQETRVQYLQRLLQAPFMEQEYVYQPFVSQMLKGVEAPWHLVIDRTTLAGYDAELLMIGLAFRKHAIPLVWQVIDFGCTGAKEQIQLWQRVKRLIPAKRRVIAHGDSEFGSVAVMRFIRQQGWDFIFGQAANTNYRPYGSQVWGSLRDLSITPRKAIYLTNIEWTQTHAYSPVNVFAFFAPRQNAPESPRRDVRYQTTSLPIAHTLRQLGRRRWSIETCFKDFKSAGWNLEASAISHFQRRDSLIILLSLNYLWATSVGRWLCKTRRRYEVDAKQTRHLSLFRIGWDWLVSQFRHQQQWHFVSTLYS